MMGESTSGGIIINNEKSIITLMFVTMVDKHDILSLSSLYFPIKCNYIML